MTPTGWLVMVIAGFLGIAIGYFIFKYFPNFFGKDKKMQEVLKNPHLLVEKLKSHGEIYTVGEDGRKNKLDIKVGKDKETGKEVVVVEEIEGPNPKKPKEVKKKPVKDKAPTKKRKKKGVRKK